MRVTRATSYADPKSGHECLLVELADDDGVVLVGAAYNPRSTASPTPFHSGCEHCRGGFTHERTSPLPIAVKRLVRTLLSRRAAGFIPQHKTSIYEYSVPTNGSHCRLRCWRTPSAVRIEAATPDGRALSVTRESDGELSLGGDVTMDDAKILSRAVRFMLSERESSPNEVQAVLGSLPQVPCRHPHARPCRSTSWPEVLELALQATKGRQ